jgi:hypothetical protein
MYFFNIKVVSLYKIIDTFTTFNIFIDMENNENITEQEFSEWITEHLLAAFTLGAHQIRDLITYERYEEAALIKQQVVDLVKSLPTIMGNPDDEVSREVVNNLISNFESIVTFTNNNNEE